MLNVDSQVARTADRLLAVSFAVVTQVEIWVFEADAGYATGIRVAVSVLSLVASLALIWRRSHPLISFAVNSAAIVGSIALGFPSNFYQWTNLIATYSVAAHGTARQAWTALPFAMGGVIFYFFRFPTEGGFVVAAFATAMWVVAWLAGRVYGSRLQEMQLRAERDLSMELAAAREERLALETERTRIARELHDIIGHSVNVMVIHAGAGRGAIESDPDQAAAAFRTIEETGRTALDELDRVLAVLRRDEEAMLAPEPGLDRLEDVAETFASAGLGVTLNMNGDSTNMPSSVSLSAYRIVQEALTNTLKHSSATRASIDVTVEPGIVTVEITDDGGTTKRIVEGRGILGMRERAALHGGDLAVSATNNGVAVVATLHWSQR